MSANQQHLVGLPLGQPEEPAPELIAAIARAMNNDDLVSLANKISNEMAELVRMAGFQQILQHSFAEHLANGEQPADIMQRALANIAVGIEKAKIELERSNRRLAAHRQAFQ